jgi:oligopeptide/dipeptide ABC transporter ATP-binding protein
VRQVGGDVRRQDRRGRYRARIVRRCPPPYTKALLGSTPKLGSKEKLLAIPGQPPDLATLPPGCAFHPRCPEAMACCAIDEPGETQVAPSWSARRWRCAQPAATDPPKEAHVAAAVGN